MATIELKNLVWYGDSTAEQREEPGIRHSYMASLATAINYATGRLDPVRLMGDSSFAFRIMVNENLCPSAMSIFNWQAILPEAVENSGYRCTYISRMWDEGDVETSRQQEAHAAIVSGLQAGRPAVVWDIFDDEWGLIVGYDSAGSRYHALSNKGKPLHLDADRLGRNGIDILSVAIPGEPTGRTREEITLNSLRTAVNHAEEKEWMDRPQYLDGLPAYEQWASVYDKGALLVEAGRAGNVPEDVVGYVAYYAEHYFSARCYARDYLRMIAEGNALLEEAGEHYDRVASLLRPVWEHAVQLERLDSADFFRRMSQHIREAGIAERQGIEVIKRYLLTT